MKCKYPLLRWRMEVTMRYCVVQCAGLFTVYSWRTVAALCEAQLQSCGNFGDKLWPIAPNSAALWVICRLYRIRECLTPITLKWLHGTSGTWKLWSTENMINLLLHNISVVCMSICSATVHWVTRWHVTHVCPMCPSATLLIIANTAASLPTHALHCWTHGALTVCWQFTC